MNNKHKLIPKRRFKEFENADAWEQRKLGEVGTTYTGLSGKTKEDFGHGNGQFITYMNVFSNAVASSEMVEPVEIDDRQNKVVAGDVLFTTSSETPEEVGMSSVWLENSKNTYLNSFCFGYRPIIPFDPYYLAFMLRSSLMRKKITFLAQGISRYNISKNKMMDIEIPVPIMSEQHQIGEYFRNLDYLITLHQRKLNKLAEIKSAYLSELFPVPGELKPKRRFAGYIDDWEQYEFADLLDKEDGIRRGPFGSALKKEYFVSKSDYVVYEQQNAIYDRFDTRYYITREKYEELHKFILEPEDFILSGAGTVGRISRVPKNIRKGVFNQALIRIKIENKNMDPDFFLQWMRSESMQKKLTYGNPASAIVNLVPIDEIKKWKVIVPSLDEQVKIGNLLNKLDEAIKSQNRKIEKLQNLKESYLNEMFV